MLCRYCNGKLKVIKTECNDSGVMRIRRCNDCGMVITTFEKNSQEKRANGKKSSNKADLAQK